MNVRTGQITELLTSYYQVIDVKAVSLMEDRPSVIQENIKFRKKLTLS